MEPHPVDDTVRRLATRMRQRQLQALTDRLVGLIVQAMPDYPTYASLTSEMLREASRRNLDQILGEITRPPGSPEPRGHSPLHETGERRAQQGVPLESLLHAIRLSGRVLWEGLVQEATHSGNPADTEHLLQEAVAVWDAIDHGSTVVAKAYREEQAHQQRRSQHRRETVLSTLLQGRPLGSATLVEASDVFGVRAGSPLILVTSRVAGGEAAPTPEVALAAAGFTSAWVGQGLRDAGLVALPTRHDEPRAYEVLADLLPGPATVSPVVEGFERVAEAYRVASLTLRTLPDGFTGVVRATDRLAQALLAGTPEVARVLAQHHLGPVLALRPSERASYVETIEAVVRAGGSYSAAARELFCHRNTVIKRMRRLESLTGRRLDDLGVLFDLYLAVLASRLETERRSVPD